MTLEEFAYLAEITGVILVIASLIYVARQVSQNTEMIRAESRNQIVQQHVQELLSLVEHPDIWKGLSGQDLDDESVRLNNWLIAFARAREHEWLQFRSGALDEASWKSYSLAIPIVLASERARAWWGAMQQAFDREFVEQVNRLLNNESLNKVTRAQAAVFTDAASDQ